MHRRTALAGLAACAAPTARAAEPAPAPDFALPAADGRRLALAGFRGQVVMLNFWATWCAPCKAELPRLDALHRRWRSAGFVLLGLAVDEQPAAAAAQARELALGFPVLFDAERSVSRLYAVDAMPSTLLVDREGRLRHRHRGWRDGAEALYERQLRELVKA